MCTNERHGGRVDSCQSLGSSKVRNFRHTTKPVDENIVTLDVTVDNLVVMLAYMSITEFQFHNG